MSTLGNRARILGRTTRQGHASYGGRVFGIGVTFAVLLGIVALSLSYAQTQSRATLEQRFQARGDLAVRFAHSYVADVFRREQMIAHIRLNQAQVKQSDLDDVVSALDIGSAVVLDRIGRLLAVSPAKPVLLGKNIAKKYPQLRAALAGHSAVSPVVLSAAQSIPVVGFAIAFQTPFGRRIFSGAYDVGRTPLGAYLRDTLPIAGSQAYIVDTKGALVTRSVYDSSRGRPLSTIDVLLDRAASSSSQGTYAHDREDYYFVARRVAGTPWRIILTVPKAGLYSSISGISLWVPWVIFAVLVLSAGYTFWLLLHLTTNRAELQELNRQLDRMARVDGLTGVYNRRQLDEDLALESARSLRYKHSLALLLLDLDHFKAANDIHGHQKGDRILQDVGRFLMDTVRGSDSVYRYGGEEFAIIAPDTDLPGAQDLAERLRRGVKELWVAPKLQITTSIGVTVTGSLDSSPSTLIQAADRALYKAKERGRNQVALDDSRECDRVHDPVLNPATGAA
jgi:diguanylate cyclase (GGDEF)-like protein